jgi:hypothetical protein
MTACPKLVGKGCNIEGISVEPLLLDNPVTTVLEGFL